MDCQIINQPFRIVLKKEFIFQVYTLYVVYRGVFRRS